MAKLENILASFFLSLFFFFVFFSFANKYREGGEERIEERKTHPDYKLYQKFVEKNKVVLELDGF